jgi:hypothetical protein
MNRKTNNQFLKGLAAAVAAIVVTTGANADTIRLDYGWGHQGNGGAFLVTSIDQGGDAATAWANYSPLASSGHSFETFCIEYNEEFSPGGVYNYAVSPAAIHGGNAVNDALSVGTGYLYSLFAQGFLDASVYAIDGDSNAAGNLQRTIWFLEGEGGILDPGTYDGLLIAEFGSVANAQLDLYGTLSAASFGVAALNVGDNDFQNQDQLIYQGLGRQVVPDGGSTLALLGLTMSGLSLLRRKLA